MRTLSPVLLLVMLLLVPLPTASAACRSVAMVGNTCLTGQGSYGNYSGPCDATKSGFRYTGVLGRYNEAPTGGVLKAGGYHECYNGAEIVWVGAVWAFGAGPAGPPVGSGGIVWTSADGCRYTVSLVAAGHEFAGQSLQCVAGDPVDPGWGTIPVLP